MAGSGEVEPDGGGRAERKVLSGPVGCNVVVGPDIGGASVDVASLNSRVLDRPSAD